MRSEHFESFSVKGDKITLHKCVIDKAIKYINANWSYDNEDRRAGKLDIIRELLECIDRWNYYERCKEPTRGQIKRMREEARKAEEREKYINSKDK